MRRYSVASRRIFSGACINRKSGSAANCPEIIPDIPIITAITTDVRTANVIYSLRPLPISPATSIFAPTDSPEDTVTISAMISVLLPTAASASLFPK